jgi:hypothetical protein
MLLQPSTVLIYTIPRFKVYVLHDSNPFVSSFPYRPSLLRTQQLSGVTHLRGSSNTHYEAQQNGYVDSTRPKASLITITITINLHHLHLRSIQTKYSNGQLKDDPKRLPSPIRLLSAPVTRKKKKHETNSPSAGAGKSKNDHHHHHHHIAAGISAKTS